MDRFDQEINRRQFLLTAAAAGLAVPSVASILAACGSSGSSPAPAASGGAPGSISAAGVTVNLYDTMPQSTQQYWLNTLYPEFQKQYPNVAIKETNGGVENPLTLRTMVKSGTAASPDMAWMESGEMGAYADAGLLADVNTWLNGKPEVKADIFPSLVTLCTYAGKVQSLPWMTNNCAMLINTDAFKTAGVPVPSQDPTATWTWEDFQTACAAITQKANMKGYLMPQSNAGWDYWLFTAWLGAAGGTFLSPTGDPLFQGQEGTDAMTFLQGLVKGGYTAALSGDAVVQLALWYQKKAAIVTNGPWNFPDLVKFKDFNWTVVPYPRHKQPATNTGGDNLFIFNHAADKLAGAFDYATYMLSTDFQVKFNLQSGNLPVTKSATQDPAYQKQLTDYPFLKGWVNQVPYGIARSALPQASAAGTAFGNKAWDPIIVQGADVKQSLDTAATAVTALK